MSVLNIYLSGGMGGLPFEEQIGWRNQIVDTITFDDSLAVKPVFFNPPIFYSPSFDYHKSEKEVMEFDLYKLRKSDIVIVNFNVPNSIGTAMELILAKEYHIPIIGINIEHKELHPWVSECCGRMCDSIEETIEYVKNYYLVN